MMMRKSPRQIQAAKTAKFLATLSPDSEFFGFIGRGYPNSFYRVLVRATPTGKWWRFQGEAGPSTVSDPLKAHAKLKVSFRTVTIWGPLSHLADYECWSERPALVRLFERAKELHEKPEK